MSTILKALRRLEEQRTQGEGRPLREEVATGPRPPEPPAAPRRVVRWAVAGFAVLALVIAAGLALRHWPLAGAAEQPVDVAAQPAPVPPAPADAAREARAKSRVQPVRAPRAKPRLAAVPPAPAAGAPPASVPAPPDRSDELPAGLPDQAFASPVEVVPRPPAEARRPMKIARAADPLPGRDAVETPPAAKPAPAPAPAPAPVVARSEAAAPPRPAAAKAPPPQPAATPAPDRIAAAEPEPVPEPAPVAPEPNAIDAQPAHDAPAPVVDAEPQEFTARATGPSEPPASAPDPGAEPAAASAEPRPEVPAVAPGPPSLLVSKTLWHPQADRRVAFVSLDGAQARRIHEGDVVGRYVVSEIQPSGVVFLDDGEKVRRAVGAK